MFFDSFSSKFVARKFNHIALGYGAKWFRIYGSGRGKLLIQYPFRVIRCGPRIYLRHTQKNVIASLVLTCGFCLHKISTKMGGGERVVRKEGFTRTLKTTLIFKATHEI